MKHIQDFESFLNEAALNESVFDVQKNAKKLTIFGVMPVKIIHAEQSNDYRDSGTSVTDRIIPDFNTLEYTYKMRKQPGDKISFEKGGGIGYSTDYGAERIISFQNPKMQKQSWYLNLIFANKEDAKTAWDNFIAGKFKK
jgi:hypothetical protein